MTIKSKSSHTEKEIQMKISNEIAPKMSAVLQVAVSRVFEKSRDQRGDIPGWVLVTVMTAGLVVAVWSVADGQLKTVLTSALRSVSQP
jgi:hypothetical protein